MECPVKSHSNHQETQCPRNSESECFADTKLATGRIASSIPRGDGANDGNWLYPSPQMFFSAMQRKGHRPSEADMEVIVNIHNMVNEQTWQQILRWENYYHPSSKEQVPRLQRFLGRPSDISPKAWFRSALLGYKKPFDRHDWYVEGRDGVVRRYVIDFYAGKGTPTSNLPSFHIDARPAVDNLHSAYARAHCCLQRTVTSVQRIWNHFIDNVEDQ